MKNKKSDALTSRPTIFIVTLALATTMFSSDGGTGLEDLPGTLEQTVCSHEVLADLVCTTAGEKLWLAEYDGPGSGPDSIKDLTVGPSGRIYTTALVVGIGTGEADMGTIVYDPDGSEVWVAHYDGPVNGIDVPSGIALNQDESLVYITGESDGLGTGRDFATVAYDIATGLQVWVGRYAGITQSSVDQSRAITVSPDGSKVFVTGNSGGSTISAITTVAYDATNGDELWVQRYEGESTAFVRNAIGNDVGVSRDGETVFVTGQSAGVGGGFVGNFDYTTIAYHAVSGEEQWLARYDGPANGPDTATSLSVNPDGRHVFVTGYSQGDFTTVAYDPADGSRLWTARYSGPIGTDRAFAIDVSPNSTQVFVTGESASVQGLDFATVAYDATTGSQMWVKRYHGPATTSLDHPSAMAVSPTGSYLAVTGRSDGDNSRDITTITYATNDGTQLWVDRHNGPANGADYGLTVGISPDGETVYAAGEIHTVPTSRDAVIIAYNAFTGIPGLSDIDPGEITPPSGCPPIC